MVFADDHMLFASQQDFAREFTLWEITSVGYYRKVQRTFTQTWKHSRHKAFSHLDFDLRIAYAETAVSFTQALQRHKRRERHSNLAPRVSSSLA